MTRVQVLFKADTSNFPAPLYELESRCQSCCETVLLLFVGDCTAKRCELAAGIGPFVLACVAESRTASEPCFCWSGLDPNIHNIRTMSINPYKPTPVKSVHTTITSLQLLAASHPAARTLGQVTSPCLRMQMNGVHGAGAVQSSLLSHSNSWPWDTYSWCRQPLRALFRELPAQYTVPQCSAHSSLKCSDGLVVHYFARLVLP